MIDAAITIFGRLDIACNSAAVSRGSGPIHEFERSVFDDTLEMCLTNTWLCLKHEVGAMLDSGKGGSIVNISSNSSLRGQPYNTAYAAAKSGVNVLTKSSAVEYGKRVSGSMQCLQELFVHLESRNILKNNQNLQMHLSAQQR